MNQTRITSLRESMSNTAVGFAISLAAQWVYLVLVEGLVMTFSQNVRFAIVMTVISIARGYVIRRWFERKRESFNLTSAVLAVLAERKRQEQVEGWTLKHDDQHPPGELGMAGASYLISAQRTFFGLLTAAPPMHWPWDVTWWKPRPDDPRRDLVRGVALALAELERFDRNRKPRQTPDLAKLHGAKLVSTPEPEIGAPMPPIYRSYIPCGGSVLTLHDGQIGWAK